MSWSLTCILCQVLFWTVAFLIFVHWMFLKRYAYWKRKKIYNPQPRIPFGNVNQTKNFALHLKDIYDENKHRPYLGIFIMHKPIFIVNDLDLMKKMYTRDFLHFANRGFQYDPQIEPLFQHSINLTGDKWKNMRQKLTPTFTSNKMKDMFNIVLQCADEMSIHLDKVVNEGGEVDMKDTLSKLTINVIANCAFGIECNSFINPNNKFRQMAIKVFKPKPFDGLRNVINIFNRKLGSILRQMSKGKELENFYYNLVKTIVTYREKNKITRNDYIQLLINLRNSGNNIDYESDRIVTDASQFSMMNIAAQAFEFVVAGFDTPSAACTFALYEIALNPEVQNTLRKEIEQALKKFDGNATYDSLAEMEYMTRVIEETLRKYPSLPIHYRMCTKDYVIPGTDITLESGTRVMFPLYAINRNPEIHPNPDEFNPDRFTKENKESRHPFANITFGEGPRNCIGKKFGMMLTKLALTVILSQYEVSAYEKTAIPIKFQINAPIFLPVGGVWLKLSRL